jgi:hypothetical protein
VCVCMGADLITLNGAHAGADEFFPVLVYVVVQANPPGLLSTVQYIRYFYEPRASGEDSYWWNQFVMAVQFVKTLEPAPAPPTAPAAGNSNAYAAVSTTAGAS